MPVMVLQNYWESGREQRKELFYLSAYDVFFVGANLIKFVRFICFLINSLLSTVYFWRFGVNPETSASPY